MRLPSDFLLIGVSWYYDWWSCWINNIWLNIWSYSIWFYISGYYELALASSNISLINEFLNLNNIYMSRKWIWHSVTTYLCYSFSFVEMRVKSQSISHKSLDRIVSWHFCCGFMISVFSFYNIVRMTVCKLQLKLEKYLVTFLSMNFSFSFLFHKYSQVSHRTQRVWSI